MAESKFTYVTYIRTTPEQLWHALTSPELIRKYWFEMRVEGRWEMGSKWKYYLGENLMDSGEILEAVPQKRLVRRWFNEWKSEFKAEGESLCVVELERVAKSVRLTITHSMRRADSKFIKALSDAWPLTMSNLKSLLETGEPVVTEHQGHED